MPAASSKWVHVGRSWESWPRIPELGQTWCTVLRASAVLGPAHMELRVPGSGAAGVAVAVEGVGVGCHGPVAVADPGGELHGFGTEAGSDHGLRRGWRVEQPGVLDGVVVAPMVDGLPLPQLAYDFDCLLEHRQSHVHQAAEQLKPMLDEAKDQAKSMAQEAAEHLRPEAEDAVTQVREQAAGAAETRPAAPHSKSNPTPPAPPRRSRTQQGAVELITHQLSATPATPRGVGRVCLTWTP
jgi:hypothetical protein